MRASLTCFNASFTLSESEREIIDASKAQSSKVISLSLCMNWPMGTIVNAKRIFDLCRHKCFPIKPSVSDVAFAII